MKNSFYSLLTVVVKKSGTKVNLFCLFDQFEFDLNHILYLKSTLNPLDCWDQNIADILDQSFADPEKF